ncbi:MAG: hypothetical protein JXR91_15070 [Deltaproteobacteria bacterium]|nr:hypothetical protein [Deltaproteobacteria bacterium]
MRLFGVFLVLLFFLMGCSDGNGESQDLGDSEPVVTSSVQIGDVHKGQYHLGPVDFAETDWHNACAPGDGYRGALLESTGLGGEYLAGVSNTYNLDGGVCDACILIETDKGNSIVARVVTYGVSNEAGDLDVSPSVYEFINEEEYPRGMSWRFTACPDTGNLYYEIQTEANEWWTSLWVRNPKVPVVTVEVKSKNHSDYFEMKRGMDGTFTDAGGFGSGEFTLRITAMDNQVIEETFDGFTPGELIESAKQFQ